MWWATSVAKLWQAMKSVRFEELPAGEYVLTIEGGYEQNDLLVDGHAGQSVAFAPLATAWEVQVTRAESMPGYSVVRVEVEGKSDVPVYIWKEGWEGMMKRSGSNATNPFSLEFSPLGPGTYMIEPDGLNVWTDVELTGLEAVWITFRPRSTPASPNRITRIAPVARTGDAPAPRQWSAAPGLPLRHSRPSLPLRKSQRLSCRTSTRHLRLSLRHPSQRVAPRRTCCPRPSPMPASPHRPLLKRLRPLLRPLLNLWQISRN